MGSDHMVSNVFLWRRVLGEGVWGEHRASNVFLWQRVLREGVWGVNTGLAMSFHGGGY